MFPRKSWLATLCLFFSGFAFSQQPAPKTLLWRISGNGLQQPSYLFGTMHLNDKRLFHFGDSLYSALERTEGFAMEVNPDEMAAYLINNMLDESKSRKLDELLGDDYDKYSDALSRKLDKPAADITANDILKERNKWVNQFMEKGEMPTFVDAYLFDIARRQGKWVGGIEDIADQAGILEELVDKWDIEVIVAGEPDAGKDVFDKMVRLYLDQDIQGIDEMVSGNAKHRDILLIRRNVKMARRMDSLSAIRTTFFAVGAAHLPGDSGVITLLRKRGFVVEPVFASKKVRPEDYKYKKVELRWVTVSDKQQLYTVQMPGNPAPVNYLGLMEMQFHMDIASNMGYCTMTVINPRSDPDEEEMYKTLAEKMFGRGKMNKPKKIEKNGVQGREFSGTADGNAARVQIFMKDKVVYFVMAYAMKKEGIRSPDVDKFFNSFTITGNIPVVAAARTFTNDEMAISVNAPVELTLNTKMNTSVEEGWKASAYTGVDMNTGGYYMLLERKITPGLYIMNDSTLLQEYITAMRVQFASVTDEGIRHFRNGKGYMLKGPSSTDKSIYTKMLMFTRGNRIYIVSAFMGSKEIDNLEVNTYFSSVELLPYRDAGWQSQLAPGGGFETWSPAPFKKHSSGDDTEDSSEYMAFDSYAATTLSYFTDSLGKWYWAESDSAFWKSRTNAYNDYQDSIVSEQAVQNGDAKGRELLVQVKDATTMKRIRMLLNGDVVHYLLISGEPGYLRSENVNRFFSDFRFLKPVQPVTITVSKAKELIAALSAEDSTTRAQAGIALNAATFSPKDLPLLHGALFKQYKPSYEWEAEGSLNRTIADKLVDLKDPSSLELAKNKYSALTGDLEHLKWVPLEMAAKWKTRESYDIIKKLLNTKLPTTSNYSFFYALDDSADLAGYIYPELLKHVADTTMGLGILGITPALLDSGVVTKQLLVQHEPSILRAANHELAKALSLDDEGVDYDVFSLIDVLQAMETTATKEAIRKFLKVKSNDLKLKAVSALLDLEQEVSPEVFSSLGNDVSSRLSLYEALEERDMLHLFPKQFANQKSMAEAMAFANASDEDEPTKIVFIAEKQGTYQGKQYKFYLYKITFGADEYESSYLGFAGAYDLAGKKLKPEQNISGLYWQYEYDASKINTYFREWLASFEEEGEMDELVPPPPIK
jgi:uncharacterized protein YbaP (TraB family)